jgi:hypothetical protein
MLEASSRSMQRELPRPMRYIPGIIRLAPSTPFGNHRDWRSFLLALTSAPSHALQAPGHVRAAPLDFPAGQWLGAACQTNTDSRSRVIR